VFRLLPPLWVIAAGLCADVRATAWPSTVIGREDDVRDQDGWSEEFDIAGSVGRVTTHLYWMMHCATDWGGWQWMARGLDATHAKEHLKQRLERLDPFFGGEDYGPPGFPSDGGPYRPVPEAVQDLDERIPEPIRDRIRGYVDAIEERWKRDYPPPTDSGGA
jgi:hypothetical protein